MSKVIAPQGFKFIIDKDPNYKEINFDHLIKLFDNKIRREIGTLRLSSDCKAKNRLVTHSFLHYEYHGRGLGTLLYAKGIQWALEQGYAVRSSGCSSDAALRVWQSRGLRKHFVIASRIVIPKYAGDEPNERYRTYYVRGVTTPDSHTRTSRAR